MGILFYVLLAILEFFLINWMGKHSISSGYYQISFVQNIEDAPLFNAVFRVLAPNVFLVTTAALWLALSFPGSLHDYWLVTAFYFVVRWSYNLLMGRTVLLNWPKQLLTGCLSTALSFLVATTLLTEKELLLPSARALTDQIWIVIIGFVYLTATRVSWPTLGKPAVERKKAYLRQQFIDARRQFGEVIFTYADGRGAEVFSFAILIYESFNRPHVYQFVENRILFPAGLAQSLGPMQVQTQLRLSDSELVRMGVERASDALARAFEAILRDDELTGLYLRRERKDGIELDVTIRDSSSVSFHELHPQLQGIVVRKAAAEYNVRSDYPDEVAGIFEFLRDEYYPDLNPELSSAGRQRRSESTH